MLNSIEKFKVAILHLNRDWNHWTGFFIQFWSKGKIACQGGVGGPYSFTVGSLISRNRFLQIALKLLNALLRTEGRTDGRYQVHYLPRFAVDKKPFHKNCELTVVLFFLINYKIYKKNIKKNSILVSINIDGVAISSCSKHVTFWSCEHVEC